MRRLWIGLFASALFTSAALADTQGFRYCTSEAFPEGTGRVVQDPEPEPYVGKYGVGTVITLTAYPVRGFAFSYWSGTISGTENPIELAPIEHDVHAIANFVPSNQNAGAQDRALAFALLPNAPNPFASRTLFAFTLPRAASTTLRVFDVRGRLVSTLARTTLSAGLHQVEWNGRDDAGRRLGAGIYLARLESAGLSQSRRVCLIR